MFKDCCTLLWDLKVGLSNFLQLKRESSFFFTFMDFSWHFLGVTVRIHWWTTHVLKLDIPLRLTFLINQNLIGTIYYSLLQFGPCLVALYDKIDSCGLGHCVVTTYLRDSLTASVILMSGRCLFTTFQSSAFIYSFMQHLEKQMTFSDERLHSAK